MDNSMTKKLYTYTDQSQEEGERDPHVPEAEHAFKNNLLSEARDHRKPLNYSVWRFCCKKNFTSPWCCCCRHRDSHEDKLQGKARTRLYGELDILKIIQQLRVSKFMAEQTLSPEQTYLVNYHSEYMLFRKDDNAPCDDFSRYTDHRKDDASARVGRMKRNVADCIHSLDPHDPSHQQTYKRIMARGRDIAPEMGTLVDDLANNQGNYLAEDVVEARYSPLVGEHTRAGLL